MSMTPYEIRLELIKIAARHIDRQFRTEVRAGMKTDEKGVKLFPEDMEYPSIQEVVDKAAVLNKFISSDTTR